MSKKAKDVKAFPISDTLRDLALLRASDVDLSTLVTPQSSASAGPVDEATKKAVDLSYTYVAETRKTVAINNKGNVDVLGEEIEGLRGKLDEVSEGLASC
ncbi:hypothetical protein ONZ45_g13205 [Pleurotus djamor]|nr:hypothetical protein ONZ45_g13205 [Pleurotus djamor]